VIHGDEAVELAIGVDGEGGVGGEWAAKHGGVMVFGGPVVEGELRSANSTVKLRPGWLRLRVPAPGASKRLVQDLSGRTIDDDLRADTARRIADIRVSPEGREGIQSFLARRKPAWLAP